MIRQRDYLRAKANKTGSIVLRQAYSQVRVKVNQKLYELRKNYYTGKIEQHKYDLKNTWKVLKGAIGKAHKTMKLKRLILKVKNFLIKSKLHNCAMITLSPLVISLPKVYSLIMNNLLLPISSQPQYNLGLSYFSFTCY